jgi:hypothetical protein
VRRLLVTSSVVPSSDSCHPDEGALYSPETSFLTRVTRRNIPEDTILLNREKKVLRAGFELMIPVFDWRNTIAVLECAAAVIRTLRILATTFSQNR